jgi:DNA-directed RNA polymerase specialized sigma24 family protein
MKSRWTLTQEAFDGMLTWLDPDREKAAQRYEQIRARLITMLSGRGCTFAEEVADETFNRVARKVTGLAGSYEGDPALYFYGVARKVHLEYARMSYVPKLVPAMPPSEELEHNLDCLEHCIQTLDTDSQLLILDYYQSEKRAKIECRRQLAEKLGIGVQALRMRATRIRASLQSCVSECVQTRVIH